MNLENKPKSNPFLNKLSTLLFYASLFIFIVALAFPHNPAGNWNQQFMPNIGSKQINDITFIDSLTGFAVASRNVNPDTASILKTTDGGDTWQIIFTQTPRRFSRIKFINSLTGFISGGSGSGTPYLYKSTDAGNNWTTVPGATLGTAYWNDMAVLNEDTIWLIDANSLSGGVFFTSNGGASWQNQINLGSQNPGKIYMYNGRIGFFSSTAGLYKTTNSGAVWFNASNDFSFSDMFFVDSLTGWKASGFMKKTTNGGLNWNNQTLPSGGNILITSIEKFSNVNDDTIYGVSGYANTGSGARGIVYRTTNKGDTWLFQIPDSTINIFRYFHTKFINKQNGWAYNPITGIHTTNAGDPIWYTPVTQISSEVPKEYKLFNNYPNPFNPVTNFGFRIVHFGLVTIKIYDIAGKEVTTLLNEELKAGEYKTDWNATGFSSGVYFYSLIIEGNLIDTKRMVLIK